MMGYARSYSDYIDSYGAEKFILELAQYEKIIGEAYWIRLNELRSKNKSYGLQKFHEEVILKVLEAQSALP
jgi:hypothetical protein